VENYFRAYTQTFEVILHANVRSDLASVSTEVRPVMNAAARSSAVRA